MHCLKSSILALALIGFCMAGCKLKKTEAKVENEEERFTERDQMQKAMEQEFLMTVDPALGYVPKERLIKALNYEKKLLTARLTGANALSWQERGPNNISGRTRAVLIDAKDASGNTVFAAGVSGGIWKTTNFKSASPAWKPVNESMGSLAVCALAQNPSKPDTIYAGTGEGWFNNDAVHGNGIWKSVDGGTTWNHIDFTDSLNTDHNFDFIQDLAVTNSNILFVTARPSYYCNVGGVLRTTDGGKTWSRPIGTWSSGQPCDSAKNFFGADLEIAANGDLYATTGFINSGKDKDLGRIWRSRGNNGSAVGTTSTWINITPSGGPWQRIDLAIAPSNPAVIYALLEGSGDGIGAIKKSVDTGATWTNITIPTWCNQGTNSADFTNGQAFYDLIVQVDPANENNVIIGGIDLFRSTDGGASWNQITQWARNCASLPVVHADHHNLLFFPGSSTQLIDANDGGVYYSTDGGTSWATTTTPNLNGGNQTTISQKNIGYNITQLYACDIHPTANTNYFLVGSQDNGSFELKSAGLGDGIEASVGGDGGFCHIDQTDGNLQILSYVYNNYYYSTNGGGRFNRVSFNDQGFFINPSDLDDKKKVLYTSYLPGKLGLVSSLTVAPSFSSFDISASLGANRKISALKVDPTVGTGGTVWIAGYDTTENLKPNIIKLTTANTAPAAAVSTLINAPAGSYVSSIDVDPANADHILVTLSNYGVPSVFESVNGGSSFTNIEGNLPDIPVRWGMFLPANAYVAGYTGGGILLATEIGVWFAQFTAGSGTAWTPQNAGLPNVRTDMLRYRASDNLIAAATHGRGLFTTSALSIGTGVPTVPNTKNFIDYVSASQQKLFIKVGNLNTATIETRLFSVDGKLVYSSRTKYADQNVPVAQLASGSYIIKIYGNKNEQFTKQFVK